MKRKKEAIKHVLVKFYFIWKVGEIIPIRYYIQENKELSELLILGGRGLEVAKHWINKGPKKVQKNYPLFVALSGEKLQFIHHLSNINDLLAKPNYLALVSLWEFYGNPSFRIIISKLTLNVC